MKDLSIEEKARRYDESIERAKQLSKELTVDDIVEQIFPELVKSKDEKIRIKLIEFFVGYTTDKEWWGSITEKDILAWLEKQCEQKPAEWSKKDEQISNAIIKRLSSSDALSVSLQSAISWVENVKDRVQPQWKPSEEQLTQLYYASTGISYSRATLISLLEQLRKLKD